MYIHTHINILHSRTNQDTLHHTDFLHVSNAALSCATHSNTTHSNAKRYTATHSNTLNHTADTLLTYCSHTPSE